MVHLRISPLYDEKVEYTPLLNLKSERVTGPWSKDKATLVIQHTRRILADQFGVPANAIQRTSIKMPVCHSLYGMQMLRPSLIDPVSHQVGVVEVHGVQPFISIPLFYETHKEEDIQ